MPTVIVWFPECIPSSKSYRKGDAAAECGSGRKAIMIRLHKVSALICSLCHDRGGLDPGVTRKVVLRPE